MSKARPKQRLSERERRIKEIASITGQRYKPYDIKDWLKPPSPRYPIARPKSSPLPTPAEIRNGIESQARYGYGDEVGSVFTYDGWEIAYILRIVWNRYVGYAVKLLAPVNRATDFATREMFLTREEASSAITKLGHRVVWKNPVPSRVYA